MKKEILVTSEGFKEKWVGKVRENIPSGFKGKSQTRSF